MKKFIVFTLLLLTTFFAFAEKRYYSYAEDIYFSYFELTPVAYEKIKSKEYDSVAETLTDIRNNDIIEERDSDIISEYELAQFIGNWFGPKGIDDVFSSLEERRCCFTVMICKNNNIGIYYFYK